MNSKTKKIIGWILSTIVLLLMAASAIDKICGSSHSLEMTHSFGIAPGVYHLLGIIELGSVTLFTIPRTDLLGFCRGDQPGAALVCPARRPAYPAKAIEAHVCRSA